MKYRIITDGTYYIVQSKSWWPFWVMRYQCSNLYGSTDAQDICERVIARLKENKGAEEPGWRVLDSKVGAEK